MLIGFLLFEGALALNITGPAEVFSSANRLARESGPIYRLTYLSAAGGLVRTESGVAIDTSPIAEADLEALDTLIVVGGVTVENALRDAALIDWIGRAASVVRRTCSVCTGAFLLAAAGLLDGRRAVTHWAAVDDLRARFPSVRVELDPIHIEDGDIWTSAGISAGLDLALALVESDRDRNLSLAVAKELVVFLQRPGGQAQFSRALATQSKIVAGVTTSKLDALHGWIVENLDKDLSVEALAGRLSMAPRTFARRFSDCFGQTPAKLVEDLRLEAARRHLEDARLSVKQIAALCGFGDEERMRRIFVRVLRVPPTRYRELFGARAAPNV
jgi:transcriptional regulator GlxA family with amidase domain